MNSLVNPFGFQYLFVRAVPSGGHLGVDELTVPGYFEHAPTGAHEIDLGVRVTLLDACRQTGGSGFVVSDAAVFDSDSHVFIVFHE